MAVRDPFIDKVVQDVAADKDRLGKLRVQRQREDDDAFEKALLARLRARAREGTLPSFAQPPDWLPPVQPPPEEPQPVGEKPLLTEAEESALMEGFFPKVPSFSEWSATKGFDMTEYATMLKKRGVAEADIPGMLLTTQKDLRDVYELEFGLGRWGTAGGELEKIAIGEPQRLLEAGKVFGQALTKVPKQLGAARLKAMAGMGGAGAEDRDRANRLIQQAQVDINRFQQEISVKYPDSKLMEEIAQLPPNIAFSLTSMVPGIAVGVPIAVGGTAVATVLAPVTGGASLAAIPFIRAAAWGAGSAASGLVAYNMTAYQIMQTYLEAKNEEMIATRGSGITASEEAKLKKEFEGLARAYGLWEAVPEAISNLAFARILTAPLTRIAGKKIATRIVGRLAGLYGEELLTETITQKGQTAIEVEAGLREGRISWIEAFKEVAPQTFLLTTILGGMGSIGVASFNKVKAVNQAKQALKTEIGVDHPLYQALLNGINERMTEVLQEGAMAQGGLGKPTPGDFPWFITQQQQIQLSALGYTEADIDKMTGTQAQDILAKWAGRGAAPEVTPAPEVTKLEHEIRVQEEIILPTEARLRVVRKEISDLQKEGVYSGAELDALVVEHETLVATFNKEGVKLAELQSQLKTLTAIPKAEVVTPPAPAVEITAEAAQTWTEAGIQPSMLPEEVAAIEVRPPAKGKITQISMDDQLKLEQAKQAAEEAPEETQEAYQAQWELEGLKAVHQVDPVALWTTEITASRRTKQPDGSFKLTEYKRKVGFDFFIPIGQTEFPDTLTVKQARMIRPVGDYSRWLQKGTREYNKVPQDVVLDPIASELGFTGTTAVKDLVARINQVRREKAQLRDAEQTIRREMTERPLPAVPELTTEEVAEQWSMLGQPRYNLGQINALVEPFAQYVMNPNIVTAYELARQTLALQRSERFNNLKAKLAEIQVQTGEVTEERARQIITDTLSGKYWVEMTDYLQFITGELRDAHFAKVSHVLKDYPAEYAGTITALVNALSGRPIPNVRPTPPPGGFKSVLWPEGASALDKLQYVFGKGTRHMKALEKMAAEKKPLDEVVEGVFREIGQAPIPVELKDYPPTIPYGKPGLFEKPSDLRVSDLRDPKELLWAKAQLELGGKLADGTLTLDEYQLELTKARDTIWPPIPPRRFDAPIEDVFKQPAFKGWTMGEKQLIVRVLKEAGLTIVDIGNLLRANVASFDNSFLRQSKVLATGHPLIGAAGHQAAWQSMFSQKHAEAEWQLITRDPDYALYEEVRARSGADPLRVPSFVNEKGTERYRRAEEYGFPGGERFIPRLTTKIPWIKLSERAFVAGTNKIVWGVWKSKLRLAHRMAEKIASGEMKLAEGEAFDIVQEMIDHQKMLANFIQRASLGRLQGLAPEISAIFFAARSKLGRWFFPIHLTGLSIQNKQVRFNPRVMGEAWRDFILMNAFWGGLMFLGDWLGLWETEDDPRNAEFGSARIGKIRIDPWSGHRQFVVLYARLATGTGISSVTGAEYEVNKLGALQTFLRSSLSPMLSILVDFWTGRNFLGQVVEITNGKEWLNRVMPFLIKDVWDAHEEEGVKGAVIAVVPGIYGEGVQTYTGDWEDNWQKLGLPKYIENTAYGLTDPKYDTADFWSDTAPQFKGVDPATLTAQKGFPDYIRAIAEARVINEHLDTLPNKVLTKINADPAEGPTFIDYYSQWKTREGLVAAGDKALWQTTELQPDGTHKKITHKGEKALEAFDKDEPTRNANNGNMSQVQFALLNQYWLIKGEKQRELFAEKHKAEIGINPRLNYLETHPKENAQLAVWGPNQAKVLTDKAYEEFKKLNTQLDIPESAISQDIERTEADLKLLPYWELPSSPAFIRRSYRAAHPEIQALLKKYHDYADLAPERLTTTSPEKGLSQGGERLREELIKAMGGK